MRITGVEILHHNHLFLPLRRADDLGSLIGFDSGRRRRRRSGKELWDRAESAAAKDGFDGGLAHVPVSGPEKTDGAGHRAYSQIGRAHV